MSGFGEEDVIYSDTEDMKFLKGNYDIQSKNIDYQGFYKINKADGNMG